MAQDSYSSKSSLKRRLDTHCVKGTPVNSFHSNFMTERGDTVRNSNPTTGNSFSITCLKKTVLELSEQERWGKKLSQLEKDDLYCKSRVLSQNVIISLFWEVSSISDNMFGWLFKGHWQN